MFNEFLTNVTKPKKVEWSAPNKVYLDLGDGTLKPFDLMKGAEEYLHKQIDIKVSTSKEVFKKAESVWGELRDIQLQKCKDNPNVNERFDLEAPSVMYLTTVGSDDRQHGDIVDIIDLKKNDVEEFEDIVENFKLLVTTMVKTRMFFQDSKGGLQKFVLYDKDANIENDEYTPIVMLELNHEKSNYKVYSGILLYKPFIFIPAFSSDLEEKKYYDFLRRFNVDEMLSYTKERGEEVYNSYLEFEKNPVEISARELTSILKRVGYKLEIDDLDVLHPIENLDDEENNKMVQDFYNTFKFSTGETAFDIIKMSDFRKTFRYNKVTMLDVLAMLSKEYMKYEGSKITADILGDIVYKLYARSSADKEQVKQIENENKID